MNDTGWSFGLVGACFVLAFAGCFGGDGGGGSGSESDVVMRFAEAQNRAHAALCVCDGICVSSAALACGADLVARHADVIAPWAECGIAVYDAYTDCLNETQGCAQCAFGDFDDCGDPPPEVAVETPKGGPPTGPYADCIDDAEARTGGMDSSNQGFGGPPIECSGSGTASSGGGGGGSGMEICEISCGDISATCMKQPGAAALCQCTQGPRTGQQFGTAGCPLETEALLAACGG